MTYLNVPEEACPLCGWRWETNAAGCSVHAMRARIAALESALRYVIARNRLTPADHDRLAALLEGES